MLFVMFEESCLESAFTNEPAWRMRESIIALRYVRQRSSNTGLTGLGYHLREVSTYERRNSPSFSFALSVLFLSRKRSTHKEIGVPSFLMNALNSDSRLERRRIVNKLVCLY